MNSADN